MPGSAGRGEVTGPVSFAEATEAGLRGRRGAKAEGFQAALEADARAIKSYVADGLLAKAVARARGGLQVLGHSGTVEALGALLPTGGLLDTCGA